MIGVSGTDLGIGISLILRDNFSANAKIAASSMDELERRAERARLSIARNVNAIGAGVGLMAIRGMGQWVKAGADFQYVMNYVSSIAEKKGGIGFDKLTNKVKTLGAETMFTAHQVADGAKYMAMAGMDTAEIYNNINAAVALAGATMSKLEGKMGAADIMTNVMRGFGIEGTEKNAMRVADILTMATQKANTNLYDLHDAMKYSISTAKDLNITLEETAAMMMVAGDAGLQGSIAGTATENMLRYITQAASEAFSTKKTKVALSMLGLTPNDLKDAKGNLLSLSPILHLIKRRIEGMGTADKQNILKKIFGVRGKREGSLLLRNMDKLDEYINLLNTKSKGRALGVLHSQMETLKGSAYQFTSAWMNFKIAFENALEPVLIPLLQKGTKLIKIITKLANTPIGKWAMVGAAGFIVLKTATMGYRAIVASLRLMHLSMGSSFSSSSSTIVSGYNMMTSAASRYAFVTRAASAAGKGLARIGIGTYSGMTKNNRQYMMYTGGRSKFIKTGSAKTGWVLSRKLGKYAETVGKMAMPAMLLGMGLQAAGGSVGDSTLGKGLSVAGTTLGWAGMGAELGTIIPGVGNVVGAIVGGVGGLMYSLYSQLKAVDDEIKGIDGSKAKEYNSFNAKEWRRKIRRLQQITTGQALWYDGSGISSSVVDPAGVRAAYHRSGLYYNGEKQSPTHIIINIDGQTAMDKVVTEKEFEQLINLGIH